MAWATTTIVLTTTPQTLISQATTWAHLRNATLYDPVPFVLVTESTVPIRIGGNLSASGTTGAGVPVAASGGSVNYTLLGDGVLTGWTTSSTSLVTIQAGRQ